MVTLLTNYRQPVFNSIRVQGRISADKVQQEKLKNAGINGRIRKTYIRPDPLADQSVLSSVLSIRPESEMSPQTGDEKSGYKGAGLVTLSHPGVFIFSVHLYFTRALKGTYKAIFLIVIIIIHMIDTSFNY